MNSIRSSLRGWLINVWRSWEQFWFTACDAATLGLIRILAGGMLLYTHWVWSLDLVGFFGSNARLSRDFIGRFHNSPYAWSHLLWIDNSIVLWCTHILALVVFAALMIGLFSRTAAVLAFLLTVSYAHRAGGALFGLDQINGFLALYLMLGPCGDAYSVDHWLRCRASADHRPRMRVSTNVAIRLMQLHLCVVYLFAGLGKLFGESWWDGTALWGALANYEYQTLDMTWLAGSIVMVNLLSHVTLFWEVSYVALIWPRLTRPVMLLLAIPLHLGIAFCMGMVTFGVVMLIANLSFVSADQIRWIEAKLRPAKTQPNAAATPYVNQPPGRRRRAAPGRNPTTGGRGSRRAR